MRSDGLAPLLDLAGITEAVDKAEQALAQVHARSTAGRFSSVSKSHSDEVRLRAVHAALALYGTECDLEELRAGTVPNPVTHGAIRAYEALPALGPVWRTAPLQALARVHLLIARGSLSTDALGRPTLNNQSSTVVSELARLVTDTERGHTSSQAVLLAAVVHAELVVGEVFGPFSVLMACCAARLVLATRGLDPHMVAPVEESHKRRLPEYHGSIRAYGTRRTDGVRSWLVHYCRALGADDSSLIV